MQVILLSRVPHLGHRFDVVKVKPGYYNNFLSPKNLAKPATKDALKELEKRRAKMVIKQEEIKGKAETLSQRIQELGTLTFKRKVSDKGHLFAAIHEKDIVDSLKESINIELDVANIEMEESLKETGNYKINIVVGETKTSLNIEIKKA